MVVDFTTPVLDLKGNPVVLADGTKVLFMAVCQEALLTPYPDELTLPAADKVRRFMLALRIESTLPVEIKIDEMAEIQKLIAKHYGPLVVGRVCELFEKGGEAHG